MSNKVIDEHERFRALVYKRESAKVRMWEMAAMFVAAVLLLSIIPFLLATIVAVRLLLDMA